MTMRDMTDEEMAAVEALRNGDLTPLASIFSREAPDVHPILQRYLAAMISGDAQTIDFRIVAQRHGYIKNPHQGVRGELNTQSKGVDVAKIMAENGAFKPGLHGSAVKATSKAKEMSESQVEKYWKEYKGFIVFCLKNGSFEIPEEFWPADMPRHAGGKR